MSKIPKTPIYPLLKGNLEDTSDNKTVCASLFLAMEKWYKGELNNICFSDLLYTASKKVAEF